MGDSRASKSSEADNSKERSTWNNNDKQLKMRPLISDNELGLPLTTKVDKKVVKILKRISGIERLNDLYATIETDSGAKVFCTDALEKIGVKVILSGNKIEDVTPKTGALIVICNLPSGGVDGLAILKTMLSVRDDVKIIGNYLLNIIEPLKESIISLEKYSENRAPSSLKGIKEAYNHIKNEGVLIIFPAKKVASAKNGIGSIEESQWNSQIIKFALRTKAPILPIAINSKNSHTHYILERIHQKLANIRLIGEILNKANTTTELIIGRTLSSDMVSSLKSQSDLNAILRANISLLLESKIQQHTSEPIVKLEEPSTESEKEVDSSSKRKTQPLWSTGLWRDKEKEISREIAALPRSAKLFNNSQYDIYLTHKSKLENSKEYIESIQSSKGEQPTSKERKRAEIDSHNYFIICYDKTASKIAAAIRIGYGDEIFNEQGIDGFYAYRDFEFSRKFLDTLRSSIETSEWIIAEEYDKDQKIKWLLWRAELSTLTRSEKYDTLLSIVEICDTSSSTARKLIVNQLMLHYYDAPYRKIIVARDSVGTLTQPIFDKQTMKILNRRDYMTSFIRDADPTINPLPPTLKRYIQAGGRAIGVCKSTKRGKNKVFALLMVDIEHIKNNQKTLFHVEQPK